MYNIIYIYICTYIHIYICIYVHMYVGFYRNGTEKKSNRFHIYHI